MTEPLGHERAFELLPWLVNGSLDPSEREALDEHLRSCLPCRRELKEQRHLQEVMRTQPAVHLSAHSAFDELTRSLARGAELKTRRRGFGPFARYATVAAAGVALLAVLVWLAPVGDVERDRAEFRTLAAPAATGDARVDVIFVQTITAAQMHALLDEIGGEIAAGPTELGRYSVRLDDRDATDEQIAALLERLQRDPRVRFAGRALAPEVAP